MTSIYVLNIVASMLLLFWPIWFSRTRLQLPWINPFSITLIVALPIEFMKLLGGPLFLIEDGLLDVGYQYAVLMSNLFIVSQVAGVIFFYHFARSVNAQRYLPFQRILLGRNDLRRGARFFLFLFFLALFLLSNAQFGVVNWLLNPREGYQLYRTGQGHWYALATSSLSVSFALSIMAQPTPRNTIKQLIFYLVLGYFLASKGLLVAIFTAGLIVLWFINWRHLGKLAMISVPPLFGLLVFNLYLALGNEFELLSIVGYFDYFKNAADYYRGYINHEISLFHGEIFLSSFWAYVPRVFWADKPVVYGITHINEIFYPGLAEQTDTPAFGGAVEQFADFGPLGVVMFGFFSSQAILTGLLSYFIFQRPGLRLDRIAMSTVLLFLVMYAPDFGNYFPGGLYLILLIAVLAILRILRRSRKCPARARTIFVREPAPQIRTDSIQADLLPKHTGPAR